MDQLSPAEKAEVEGYLSTYPQLHDELRDIERSLEIFATTAAIEPPAGIKEKVMKAIRNDVVAPPAIQYRSSGLWPAMAALFGLGLLLVGYLFYQKDQEAKAFEDQISILRDTCNATTNQLTDELNTLRQLTFPDNRIIAFQSTPGFTQTDLYLHYNSKTKKNFIQVRNLPDIADNQTFQLWSIKPNQAPAPLNVFDIPQNGLIGVDFVDGTEVYAITIEPEGGSDTPTLEHLIGTASVAGI